MLSEEKISNTSIDTMSSPDEMVNYSNEFLNSLEPTGTAPQNM